MGKGKKEDEGKEEKMEVSEGDEEEDKVCEKDEEDQ